MIVKLKGLTNKGKQRVSQHGELWKVVRTVQDNPIKLLTFITPVDHDEHSIASRWINITNDNDFEVQIVG